MACPALYPFSYSRAAFLYILTALDLGMGVNELSIIANSPTSLISPLAFSPIPVHLTTPSTGTDSLESDEDIPNDELPSMLCDESSEERPNVLSEGAEADGTTVLGRA